MVRFRAAAPAKDSTDPTTCEQPHAESDRLESDEPAEEAHRAIPVPSGSRDVFAGVEGERFARLQSLTIKTDDAALAAEAVRVAAAVRCRMRGGTPESDLVLTRLLARFLLAEAMGTGSLDPWAAFRRVNVDRYLSDEAQRGPRSLRTRMWLLYDAGRVFHPGEYPSATAVGAERVRRRPPATIGDVRRLLAVAPTLTPIVAWQVRAIIDLCWGVGARRSDFATLRGSAITTRMWDDQRIALVALRNNAGGHRLVPVIDSEFADRLIALADAAGEGLVLAPHRKTIHRNELNRCNDQLRRRGHPPVDPLALRHGWMVELAKRLPAALVMHLADVRDLKVVSDNRKVLPAYGIDSVLTTLAEVLK